MRVRKAFIEPVVVGFVHEKSTTNPLRKLNLLIQLNQKEKE